MRSEVAHLDLTRVGDDQLCAAVNDRLAQKCADDGVRFARVRANDDEDLEVSHLGDRVRHRRRADGDGQRRHRCGVTQTRAVIDVVGIETLPNEFLEQIRFLV